MPLQESLFTEDGSHSLRDKRTGETYHSIHGAIQESQHVFIEHGLNCTTLNELSVFEVGFGTGLNAYLTRLEAEKKNLSIRYTTVELFPLQQAEWGKLNFSSQLNAADELFEELHSCSWGDFHRLSPHFSFRKLLVDFTYYIPDSQYDLIYFDAFSPDKQPQLWLPERFTTLASHCTPGATLTTYCAKGIVKQALRNAGFTIERLQGPPGKRHMLRGKHNLPGSLST